MTVTPYSFTWQSAEKDKDKNKQDKTKTRKQRGVIHLGPPRTTPEADKAGMWV